MSLTRISMPAFIVTGSLSTWIPLMFSKGGSKASSSGDLGLASCQSWDLLPVLGSLVKFYHLNLVSFRANLIVLSAASFLVSSFMMWYYSTRIC